MNKKILALTLVISLLCLSACNIEYKSRFTTETEETVTEETSETESASSSETTETEETAETVNKDAWKHADTLTFIDARGEEHTVSIQQDWERNDYDKTAFVYDGDDRMTYIGEGYEYRLGVDVYEAYSIIDWEAVKADGYDFAFIRIGYRGYVNPSIERDGMVLDNLLGAIRAGLDVGVYFFSQAISEEEAIEEAEYAIDILESNGFTADDLKLGIAFDPESILDEDARTDDVTGEQFTANAVAFCNTVKEAGYLPVVYSNMIWESEKLDLGELEEYTIWYADYEEQPQSPYQFEIWQYGHGESDGIEGKVDVNIQLIAK